MLLEGQVAIVTGGASGLGEAFARALAAEGARVVVADQYAERAERVAAAIHADGGGALAVGVDVRQRARVVSLVERAVEAFGQVDILVNSAGVTGRAPVRELAEAEWDRVLDVNLKGTFLCCQAALAAMEPRRYGRIVNLASSRGLYGHPHGSHYAASKLGVVAFTRSLALEVAPLGITVNALMPGQTDTPMVRQYHDAAALAEGLRAGTVGRPADVVGMLLFLVSPWGAAITGEVIKKEIPVARWRDASEAVGE